MPKKKVKKVKKEEKLELRKESEIDITQHILVPQHILLSEEEKRELLEKYKIKLTDLPKIKKNDPAIKHLNAKPGDIIKIIRKSPITGESIYYRVVVEE